VTDLAAEKLLIVNADDFGLSEGTNRGIIECHERGIVTSASLMVRCEAAGEAAAEAKTHPELSVGLHVDLGEWKREGGKWSMLYHVVNTRSRRHVRGECRAQLDRFRELMGRDPTHIDSHQHVHRDEPVRSELWNISRELGVPLRHFDATVRYCGDFYGIDPHGNDMSEAVGVDAMGRIIRSLEPGVTEVACHPGHDVNLRTTYRLQRPTEVTTLTDPAVRDALTAANVSLVNFARFATIPPITDHRPGPRNRWRKLLESLGFSGSH
jgi:predicted glycoside hydrolase/deacetylase ChbG (UPF0249 family)